jgi:hypothetical protein
MKSYNVTFRSNVTESRSGDSGLPGSRRQLHGRPGSADRGVGWGLGVGSAPAGPSNLVLRARTKTSGSEVRARRDVFPLPVRTAPLASAFRATILSRALSVPRYKLL